MEKTIYLKDLIREDLQKSCSLQDLGAWFSPLSLSFDVDNAILTVLFPHAHFQPWFEQRGQECFERSARDVVPMQPGRSLSIVYTSPVPKPPKAFFLHDGPAQGQEQPRRQKHATPRKVEEKKPAPDAFETFICNTKNEFPLAAAREVAQGALPPKYNPFVVCGKSGTGKTHLLRAITASLSRLRDPKATCLFSGTAEVFAEQLSLHGAPAFAHSYEAFVVDDLQRLAPSPALQEHIIRFMDICLDSRRQLIMASTKAPASLEGLADGLSSRLEVGLVVELKEPDIDVRMRFGQLRCRQHGIKLSRDHLLLLAQRCVKLRHLNGVILKVAAFQSLAQQDLSTADLENILRSSGEEKQISARDIIDVVAKHMEIHPEEVLGSKRQPKYVQARQTAMFLCRDLLGLSYPALGKIFGGKDHSTVIHSIQKIKDLMDRNKDAQLMVTELKRKCLSS